MKYIPQDKVVKALNRFNGDVKKMAKNLKVSPSKIYSLLKDYNLNQVKIDSKEEIEKLIQEKQDIKKVADAIGYSLARTYQLCKLHNITIPKIESVVTLKITKEELQSLYPTYTGSQIAKMYKVSSQAVFNWLYRFNIPLRGRGNRKKVYEIILSKDELISLYKDLSISDIASKYATTVYHIRHLLSHYGLDTKAGPRTKLKDDVLIEDYPNLTYEQIADKHNVHPISVLRRAKQLGLSKKKLFNLTKEFCEENQHRDFKDIAQELGCSLSTVRMAMYKYGNREVDINASDIEAFKQGLLTTKDLAKTYRCSEHIVKKHLRGK